MAEVIENRDDNQGREDDPAPDASPDDAAPGADGNEQVAEINDGDFAALEAFGIQPKMDPAQFPRIAASAGYTNNAEFDPVAYAGSKVSWHEENWEFADDIPPGTPSEFRVKKSNKSTNRTVWLVLHPAEFGRRHFRLPDDSDAPFVRVNTPAGKFIIDLACLKVHPWQRNGSTHASHMVEAAHLAAVKAWRQGGPLRGDPQAEMACEFLWPYILLMPSADLPTKLSRCSTIWTIRSAGPLRV
jgi:hypothetical protein